MPLFLVQARPITDAESQHAVRVAVERYPEVGLQMHYADHHGAGEDLWVCRAPTQDHLRRWATAADIPLSTIRHVETVGVHPRASSLEEKR